MLFVFILDIDYDTNFGPLNLLLFIKFQGVKSCGDLAVGIQAFAEKLQDDASPHTWWSFELGLFDMTKISYPYIRHYSFW